MAIDLNAYGNCTTDQKGTGVGSCDIASFGDAYGLINFNKGWSADITDGSVDFDLTSYSNLVKSLTAFPLLDIYDFTQDTPDSETSTSSTGVISEIRSGKPQFSFTFTKGSCFHKALYSKRGNGKWDFGIIFSEGVLLATNSDVSKLKGFNGGSFIVPTFKLVQGTDPQQSMASIQLLDADEFNARHVFLPFTKTDDLRDVSGVIDTAVTTSATAAGTTFSVSVTSACNTDSVILDLDDANKWVLGGTQASATAISSVVYNASTSAYDFTVDVALIATDTIQPKLNDGTYDVVEDTYGNMYKGTSNLITVS